MATDPDADHTGPAEDDADQTRPDDDVAGADAGVTETEPDEADADPARPKPALDSVDNELSDAASVTSEPQVRVRPEQTSDDTDAGWGERRDESGHDRWLREQRPPHWE